MRLHGALNPVKLLSQAGLTAWRSGEYVKGLEWLQEASDSLKVRRPDASEVEDAIILRGNLSNFYNMLALYPEALEANTEALRLSESADEVYTTDLWRFRALIFDQMVEPDSALYCLDMARRAAGNPKISNPEQVYARIDVDRASMLIDYHDIYPDSLDRAISLVASIPDSIVADNLGMATLYKGRGYVLKGHVDKGLDLLREALDYYSEKDDPNMILDAERFLLDSYSETHHGDMMPGLYEDFVRRSGEQAEELRSDALIGAEYRYRVKEKEREIAALQEKTKEDRMLIVYQWIAIACIIALTAVGVLLLAKYLKRLHRHRKTLRLRIASLLERQKARDVEVDRLKEDNRALQDEMERIGDEETVSQVTSLNPLLLSKDGAKEFRKAFANIYPRFLQDLRSEYPGLSPTDELVCMQIYLYLSNDEIAQNLGIEKASVHTARHRLRKKLSIPKDTDLNEFLQSRPS